MHGDGDSDGNADGDDGKADEEGDNDEIYGRSIISTITGIATTCSGITV